MPTRCRRERRPSASSARREETIYEDFAVIAPSRWAERPDRVALGPRNTVHLMVDAVLRQLWVPESLAPEFRKFWPLPEGDSGRVRHA